MLYHGSWQYLINLCSSLSVLIQQYYLKDLQAKITCLAIDENKHALIIWLEDRSLEQSFLCDIKCYTGAVIL